MLLIVDCRRDQTKIVHRVTKPENVLETQITIHAISVIDLESSSSARDIPNSVVQRPSSNSTVGQLVLVKLNHAVLRSWYVAKVMAS